MTMAGVTGGDCGGGAGVKKFALIFQKFPSLTGVQEMTVDPPRPLCILSVDCVLTSLRDERCSIKGIFLS